MKKILLIAVSLASIFFNLHVQALTSEVPELKAPTFVPDVDNQVFRDEIIQYVRDAALGVIDEEPLQSLNKLDAKWNNFYQTTDWSVQITAYSQGAPVGRGYMHGASLTETLKKATQLSLSAHAGDKLSKEELNNYRFKVAFDYYPARMYSFIEYSDQGLELLGNRVAVRTLDTQAVKQQITSSEAYLLRAMHPTLHGFFKFYNAHEDKQEDLLRTIYSSSSLYTLLKMHALNGDQSLEPKFKLIADFILSNQVKTGPQAGGFYYGFNPVTNTFTERVVVGTSSKTIFTLIELNKAYPQETRYTEAAKQAGNWLLTMVNEDGTVRPVAYFKNNEWKYISKQSMLYSGQVLSALSRLYAVTHDERYKAGAHKIAQHFAAMVQERGPLLGDDYRPANSISTSWAMMSLIDYAKIDAAPQYRTLIEQLSSKILSRQITNPQDVYSNGRYLDAMTTSGNGWINEVMGVYYEFCTANAMPNCDKPRQAMIPVAGYYKMPIHYKIRSM